MTTIIKTRNYRMFYALLNKIANTSGLDKDELKKDLVLQFTNNRTKSVTQMNSIEYNLMLGAMQAKSKDKPNENEHNKLRKRVMASIGGWLALLGVEQNSSKIKAIACKAAQCNDFNKIPPNKLRAIYNEFLNKQKVAENSKVLTGITPISPN